MLRYESAERESSRIVGALLARCSYLKRNTIGCYFCAMTNTKGFYIPNFSRGLFPKLILDKIATLLTKEPKHI